MHQREYIVIIRPRDGGPTLPTKGEGRSLKATPRGRKAPVIDLMQALQKSLAAVEKKPQRKPAVNAPSKKAAVKQCKTA